LLDKALRNGKDELVAAAGNSFYFGTFAQIEIRVVSGFFTDKDVGDCVPASAYRNEFGGFVVVLYLEKKPVRMEFVFEIVSVFYADEHIALAFYDLIRPRPFNSGNAEVCFFEGFADVVFGHWSPLPLEATPPLRENVTCAERPPAAITARTSANAKTL
jgi:hypothetical protein